MEDDIILHDSTKQNVWPILKAVLATKQPHRLIIKPYKQTRSLSQNSLMWMWNADISKAINKISSENINDKEIHEYLKKLFCPEKIISIMGDDVIVKSTKLLNTEEMTFYLRRIEVWSINRGINLRIPNYSEYHKKRLENE